MAQHSGLQRAAAACVAAKALAELFSIFETAQAMLPAALCMSEASMSKLNGVLSNSLPWQPQQR